MKFRIIICIITFFLSFASIAFAQHGATGGGLMTESDMQTFINRLNDYLLTSEGLEAFPEIAIHDRISNESFHDIASKTRPVARPGVQYDQFGTARTCVSYRDDQKRYFVCDQNEFKDSIDNQPRVYKILLHELFVQAGIEKPQGAEVPSEYQVSSRIVNHLFKDESWGWLPGSLPKDPITQFGIWCTDQPFLSAGDFDSDLDTKLLFWEQSGEIRFIQIKNKSVKVLFEGYAPLPQTCDQSVRPLGKAHVGYRYFPLYTKSSDSSVDLWLATNENIILRSSTMLFPSGEQIWTQILSSIFIQRGNESQQMLVSCKSLESWKESLFFNYYDSILKSPSNSKNLTIHKEKP